jgi:hypothetical protein
MTKIAGLTYVDEFTFPTEQGFTGSAGKENVRGYYRGGRVKKDPVKAAAQKPRAPGPGAAHGGYMGGGDISPDHTKGKGKSKKGMPKNVKARGGKMDYSHGGTVGVTTPRRGKSMPQQASQTAAAAKSVKKRGGGSVHDRLYDEGGKMGYARGGQVKNTSAEFVQTSGKQATMDHANFPVVNEASQRDKESGPRKQRRPRFKKGGGVRRVRDTAYADGGKVEMPKIDLSKIKGVKSRSESKYAKRIAASKKGMPKGVKNRGGLMRYAAGGYAAGGEKKPEQAGSGIQLIIKDVREHQSAVGDLVAEALAAAKTTASSGTGTPPRSATPPRSTVSSLDDPEFQVATPSTATEEAKAKAKPKPEPSIKQTGIGEHKEATFGRAMRPVMHVKLAKAGGGVVSAAKGGRKKSRKMR